jgi:Leucine-rich repeat (LRR) protein
LKSIRQHLALILSFQLALSPLWAVDFAGQVRVYQYRPDVFADRSLGVGLPAEASVLRSSLWYLRMDESLRSLYGMDALARFVRGSGVPGLDFSGHRTLSNTDIETLLRPDLWNSASNNPSYKFRFLKLGGTLTDDRVVPSIARLFDLQVLALSEKVTDRGVSFLAPLKQLRVLILPGAAITNSSLKILAQLPLLQRLSLPAAQISDDGLALLSGLPLRQLDLGPTITDQGLQALRATRTLEQLDLQASRVTAKGLSALADLPRIHTLFLGASISDKDIPSLAAFKNLKRLDLTGARITDESLQALSQLPQLEELALGNTPITGAGLQKLSRLPKLRYLEISRTRVTPADFKTWDGFASLQVLSFSSEVRLKPADVKPLGRLASLHSIVVNNQPLGKAAVRFIQRESRSTSWLLDWLVPNVEAAEGSEAELDQALEVASLLPDQSGMRTRAQGMQGLRMIHETESSLDEVIAAPTMIGTDNQQDTEKNFLGEFTVETVVPKKKKK